MEAMFLVELTATRQEPQPGWRLGAEDLGLTAPLSAEPMTGDGAASVDPRQLGEDLLQGSSVQ
jgi:hypothetical protein